MAHWAELDDNNVVIRVVVTENNYDEGYSWLMENLGGRWIKTSYNTHRRQHNEGGIPFRGFYASPGFTYDEEHDEFVPPAPYKSWVYDWETMEWNPPIPAPTTPGLWDWDEESQTWVR